MAYSHKAVIGHHSQEEIVYVHEHENKVHLRETPRERDGLAPEYVVGQHLGDSGGGEAGVHEGQVAEEEVHGDVQAGVHTDGQEDEQVSQDCGQVHGEEEQEEELLLLGLPGEPQEEELRDSRLVLLSHGARSQKQTAAGKIQKPGNDGQNGAIKKNARRKAMVLTSC